MNSKIKRELTNCFELLNQIITFDEDGNVTNRFLLKVNETQESFKTKQINEPDYHSLCLEIDKEFESYLESAKNFNS